MKRLAAICAILLTISYALAAPLFSTAAAQAETPRYAYADRDSKVYFCSEKTSESALFIIPQTYCVEILADEGDWYYAKYAEDNAVYRAVYGYCPKSELKAINEPLENKYLNVTVKLTFRADTSTALLPTPVTELSAAYYGEYEFGKTTLSYVYCGDKFGYVTDRVTNYPLNELPKPTVSEVPEPTPAPSADATVITAIVITIIAVAAIVILFLGSKKPKRE